MIPLEYDRVNYVLGPFSLENDLLTFRTETLAEEALSAKSAGREFTVRLAADLFRPFSGQVLNVERIPDDPAQWQIVMQESPKPPTEWEALHERHRARVAAMTDAEKMPRGEAPVSRCRRCHKTLGEVALMMDIFSVILCYPCIEHIASHVAEHAASIPTGRAQIDRCRRCHKTSNEVSVMVDVCDMLLCGRCVENVATQVAEHKSRRSAKPVS